MTYSSARGHVVEKGQPQWFRLAVLAFAVSAAAAVLAAAVIGRDRPIEPIATSRQTASPTDSSLASPRPVPTAMAADTTPAGSLLAPGDALELPAVDRTGEWGTIRVERGEDLGGYEDAGVGTDFFLIEFFVDYEAERIPDPADFGERDWTLRPSDPDAEQFFIQEPTQHQRVIGAGSRPLEPLGLYPGAIEIFGTPTEGWIAFDVPRWASELELELVYTPARASRVASIITVRAPGPPPGRVAVATPAPTPQPPAYVARDAMAITVGDSAEADALFAQPDTCTNPVVGYTVAYPDDWFTNTAIGDVPACSWFTPEFFEVRDLAKAPDEIWISIGVIEGVLGYIGTTEVYSGGDVTIDGMPARRLEFNPSPMFEPGYRHYHYRIELTGGELGPTFVAQTDTDAAEDYLLARAVLDRIMASLEFIE